MKPSSLRIRPVLAFAGCSRHRALAVFKTPNKFLAPLPGNLFVFNIESDLKRLRLGFLFCLFFFLPFSLPFPLFLPPCLFYSCLSLLTLGIVLGFVCAGEVNGINHLLLLTPKSKPLHGDRAAQGNANKYKLRWPTVTQGCCGTTSYRRPLASRRASSTRPSKLTTSSCGRLWYPSWRRINSVGALRRILTFTFAIS